MIFPFSNKRKIIKILIKQYLEGFRKGKGDFKTSKYPLSVIQVNTVSEKSGVDIDETFLIIRELVLRGFAQWNKKDTYYTVWLCSITPEGYFEFKNGWKRYIKELLIALGASAPFVTILIYFLGI